MTDLSTAVRSVKDEMRNGADWECGLSAKIYLYFPQQILFITVFDQAVCSNVDII